MPSKRAPTKPVAKATTATTPSATSDADDEWRSLMSVVDDAAR
jgi:hypothetical protein